jgi:uncharacterized membrane protein
MESHKKSILKTITWRIAHTIVGVSIAFFITHSLEMAAEIISAEVIWETALYYLHERGWAKWGKKFK